MNQDSPKADAQDTVGETESDKTTKDTAKGEGQHAKAPRHWKIDGITLAVMLGLSLIGLAVTQGAPNGAWECWLLIVLAYAGISIWRAINNKKSEGSTWSKIKKPLLHWASLLVTFKVLVMLEQTNLMSRDAASDCSLLVLALASFLAGVHFDRLYLFVGVFLLIMTVTIAAAENGALLIMFGIGALAVGFFYWRTMEKSR